MCAKASVCDIEITPEMEAAAAECLYSTDGLDHLGPTTAIHVARKIVVAALRVYAEGMRQFPPPDL
jgi:hypothetical protein